MGIGNHQRDVAEIGAGGKSQEANPNVQGMSKSRRADGNRSWLARGAGIVRVDVVCLDDSELSLGSECEQPIRCLDLIRCPHLPHLRCGQETGRNVSMIFSISVQDSSVR